jgi:oligopeptidase A
LDEGQQRIITSFLRASRNGGVGLEGKEKERFNEIRLRLAELGTKFRYIQ